MKNVALHYISLLIQITTYVTAAPPITSPPLRLLNGNVLGNLTLSANNATPQTTLGIAPPPTPFRVPVPNTNLLLTVSYTAYIHDRIEYWVREAIRKAYDGVYQHRRSESIADSIPDASVKWNGNPDALAAVSTDIELAPQRNLTWGMFTDCLGVVSWFAVVYPEWDFAFEVEVWGVVGSCGQCRIGTR